MLSFLLFKSIAKGNSFLKVFKKELPPHNLDAPRCYTSPLMKQGLASDRDLPGLQSHACKRAYVYYVGIQVSYGVISMIIQFLKSIISQSASNAPLLFS